MESLNKKLPDSPGVYFFRKGRQILYIGKATSLKDRVKSYFSGDILSYLPAGRQARGPAIIAMVELADNVGYKKTDSALEALLLESALIKKHKPKYNTKEKDDKSYFYVAFTNEEYPRVIIMRGRNLFADNESRYGKVFGPFPHGSELREAMNILRKIFPFRDKCVPGSLKPCFEAQIGLCPGVCRDAISKEKYMANLSNLELFLSGEKTKIIKDLEKEMAWSASGKKFEEAEAVKRRLFGLKHINDVSMIKNTFNDGFAIRPAFRIEAYDISHFGGKCRVGVMTVVENGEMKKGDYRKFKIKNDFKKANDTLDLREVLDRRFMREEWKFPDVVAVDGGKAQLNTAEKILKDLKLDDIKVVGVVKGESHKPERLIGDRETIRKYEPEILLANAEAHRFAVSYLRNKKLLGR